MVKIKINKIITNLDNVLLKKSYQRAHSGNVYVNLTKGILMCVFKSCSVILFYEIPVLFPFTLQNWSSFIKINWNITLENICLKFVILIISVGENFSKICIHSRIKGAKLWLDMKEVYRANLIPLAPSYYSWHYLITLEIFLASHFEDL